MQAASRHRSRSPAAKGRSSNSNLPGLQTWVLVKKRFWKNAVPGLVSKVIESRSIELQPDTRVNVLIPNLFVLRYGDAGSRYTELKDVELSEIRAYKGHDSTKLKDELVNAIREAAKMRMSMSEDKKDVNSKLQLRDLSEQQLRERLGSAWTDITSGMGKEELLGLTDELEDFCMFETSDCSTTALTHKTTRQLEPVRQPLAPVNGNGDCFSSSSSSASPPKKPVQSATSFERDTAWGNITASFSVQSMPPFNLCSKNSQSSQILERHATHANIDALFSRGGLLISGNAAVEAKAPELEAAPTTPVTSHRGLMRNDTPIDPLQPNPCSSGARGNALDEFKLPEITHAVSRIFRETGEDVLSKQSLENAVTQSSLGISTATFVEALVQLDERNKMLLIDDLVFLV